MLVIENGRNQSRFPNLQILNMKRKWNIVEEEIVKDLEMP